MEANWQVFAESVRLLSLGYSVIPMGRNKKPQVKWKEYQTRRARMSEFTFNANIAIVTGEVSCVAALDFESVQAAKQFWEAEHASTPMIARSPRGIHLYYQHAGLVRNAQKVTVSGATYDVRGDGGYCLAPPSVNRKGKCYEWVRGPVLPSKLPMFQHHWRPECETNHERKGVTDAMGYISRIFAVSGQAGHANTWRAVNRVRDSGADETECMAIMSEWNQSNAQPPWSYRELLHKVRCAYRSSRND